MPARTVEIDPGTKRASKKTYPGGLYIVGTERHESRRIDNQLRGRSGRQGDRAAAASSCRSKTI